MAVDDGGVDLQGTAGDAMYFQLGPGNVFFLRQPRGQRGQFVPAKGFHDGLAANVGCDAEKFAEGFVDHLHPALLVQQKDPFDHAVKQGLLADLELGMELLLFPAACSWYSRSRLARHCRWRRACHRHSARTSARLAAIISQDTHFGNRG